MSEVEKGNCCGLVMPIAAIDGCSEQHWADVKAVLSEAVEAAGFIKPAIPSTHHRSNTWNIPGICVLPRLWNLRKR